MKPKSAVGEMLAYYFKREPHLFKGAIEQQLQRLRDEADQREAQQAAAAAEKEMDEDSAAATSSMDLTLYRCVPISHSCHQSAVARSPGDVRCCVSLLSDTASWYGSSQDPQCLHFQCHTVGVRGCFGKQVFAPLSPVDCGLSYTARHAKGTGNFMAQLLG